eukprot:jgi/Botrbrau1/9478/Bobra.0252s0097.1
MFSFQAIAILYLTVHLYCSTAEVRCTSAIQISMIGHHKYRKESTYTRNAATDYRLYYRLCIQWHKQRKKPPKT